MHGLHCEPVLVLSDYDKPYLTLYVLKDESKKVPLNI